ncbi:M48 family metallopeptidase [Aliagarivorans marinus]|uniref:M48 family metallopeptidase n=1 Tax=Aliagarivorans marinus TaxID=561965 RepID=UPI000427B294|nr:M48 family metallopeptidase [Aliagarivorans marinus]
MDFFTQQDQAKNRSKQLVGLFALSLFGIVVILYTLGFMLISFDSWSYYSAGQLASFYFQGMATPDFWLFVLVICAVITGISGLKWLSIKEGGAKVAESLGGQLVDKTTTNHQEQVLLNVVEEMAIAAGIKTPPVYILEETAINAFAAGNTVDDAVIGVTRGALEAFNRDQLQGVIAHEFSHIFNGDMSLNMKLMATVAGLIIVSAIGYRIFLFTRFSRNKNANKLALVGIALMVVGSLGSVFGKFIKAAVSRQREYLADASAVQYTRNPQGIASALKLIGAQYHNAPKEEREMQNGGAAQASHMFFSHFSPVSMLASHPPLEKRIKAIEPNWDGKYN